jgi:hypothetical protein
MLSANQQRHQALSLPFRASPEDGSGRLSSLVGFLQLPGKPTEAGRGNPAGTGIPYGHITRHCDLKDVWDSGQASSGVDGAQTRRSDQLAMIPRLGRMAELHLCLRF